jgi:hypothetical protein
MKVYELRRMATQSERGESLLGFRDLGSHACYMIYGVLKPGEQRRKIKPGRGHEEIALALMGEIRVTGCYTGTLKEGFAVHIRGEEECFFENTGKSEVVYIIAGGHAETKTHRS